MLCVSAQKQQQRKTKTQNNKDTGNPNSSLYQNLSVECTCTRLCLWSDFVGRSVWLLMLGILCELLGCMSMNMAMHMDLSCALTHITKQQQQQQQLQQQDQKYAKLAASFEMEMQ